MKKNKLDAIWSISKISKKYHPIKILKIKNGNLSYFSKDGSKFVSRQLLENLYIRNGIAYFFSRKCILKENKILPKKTRKKIMENLSKPFIKKVSMKEKTKDDLIRYFQKDIKKLAILINKDLTNWTK